jgi:hypothetical protein
VVDSANHVYNIGKLLIGLPPVPVHITVAATTRHFTADTTEERGILTTTVDTIGIQEQTTVMEDISESGQLEFSASHLVLPGPYHARPEIIGLEILLVLTNEPSQCEPPGNSFEL